MSSQPRILFLSHSASRNGATILLLHLLRWLKAQSKFQIEILVNGSGELISEFREIGPTTVWRNPAFFLEALPRGWKAKLRPKAEAQGLKLLLAGKRYDLVYVNTAATWPHVPALAKRAKGLLWHIHELDYALRLTIGEEKARELFPLATRFVVVSESVRDALKDRFGVPAEKMDLVNGFVPSPNFTPEERQARRQRVRSKLGWSNDAFVVGGCGSLGWRKGTDLFLQLAKQKGQEASHFLWVGGGSPDESLQFAHDVRALDLEKRCQCVPTTSEVLDYYCAMDVFALPSREDPFPLVMLEAGACHLPVVCFEGSGGGPEYVGTDAGLTAPYLDLPAFAERLNTLRDKPELRQQLGAAGARKVQMHHNIDTQGQKMLQSIERCLKTV